MSKRDLDTSNHSLDTSTTKFKFNKNCVIIKKRYDAGWDIKIKGRVQYYGEDYYVCSWFPTPNGGRLCCDTMEDRKQLEKYYELDKEYYQTNN